jgi:hypothetical protein
MQPNETEWPTGAARALDYNLHPEQFHLLPPLSTGSETY